jgi:hypothetical protein
MIGIQQQNSILIAISLTYLVVITWMQQLDMNETAHIYTFVVFLGILLSWTLLQKYPTMEGFGIPSRPCTMYFTTDKKGCDEGYYALSDTDFQSILMQQATLLSNTALTASNYNSEKQKYDLLTKIAKERRRLNDTTYSVCKQEFPGWLEDPDQPEKIPYDTIKNRGALKDWAFCYRNVLPNTPTALYNPADIAKNYNSYVSKFGEHTIATADTAPFQQNPKNITAKTTYSNATPEFARIYFKEWKADPDASCKNSAVDSIQSLATVTPISTRYGLEFGLTENQKGITTISTIRPSPTNNNQLLYVGDYNNPDLNIIEKLWFEYVTVSGEGLILRPKKSVETYLYRFYVDFCDRLMVPPQLPFNLKTTEKTSWDLSTISGYNTKLLATNEYPFGLSLPNEMINDTWTRTDPSKVLVSILKYNTIYTIEQLRSILQGQTAQLELYISTLEDPPYNPNEALKTGLITEKYSLPPKYDKYKIRTLSGFTFENNVNMPIYLQSMTVTLADKNGLSIPIAPSTTESTYIDYNGFFNVDVPGKYEFKLVFGPTNTSHYPVESTVVVEINNTMVASYFACKNYDECNSIFTVRCEKQKECPIPLLTDLRDKKDSLLDRSMAINNPRKIHNPVQLDLPNKQNNIRIRVYIPKGASSTPNIAYVLYRKVSDVVVVNTKSIDNFRILGSTVRNIWEGYAKDSIQYRPYDIRPSLINTMHATNRILLNRNAIKQIETRRIATLNALLEQIRKDPSKIINPSKQIISQNNRIYAFFTNSKITPKTATDDLVKIQQFNDNFTKTI